VKVITQYNQARYCNTSRFIMRMLSCEYDRI